MKAINAEINVNDLLERIDKLTLAEYQNLKNFDQKIGFQRFQQLLDTVVSELIQQWSDRMDKMMLEIATKEDFKYEQ